MSNSIRQNPLTVSLIAAATALMAGRAAGAAITVAVDVAQNRKAISPLIYGVNFASAEQLRLLNSPLNRSGGNAMTRYNWEQDATNRASDWYFLSTAESGPAPGGSIDAWVQANKGASVPGGVQSMVTVPCIGWVSKLGTNRTRTWSYSVAKYGPQQQVEPWNSDMGNGITTSGVKITWNDPNDANMQVAPAFQQGWIQHLTVKFGTAAQGGVKYYLLDNEPGLWHETHRDVMNVGVKMDDLWIKFRDIATMVKATDSTALVAGPEEWGWLGYLYSGYDLQYAGEHNWNGVFPDRAAHNNWDLMPWLLNKFKVESQAAGKRLLDVFTLHYYPQSSNVASDNTSQATQLLRNRCTRSLWDANYTDESWINQKINLIPRMKNWVAANYPNTKIGVTEYSWGAENHISGATAQADVLGIFGREGVDLATRWVVPATNSVTFKAFQMYRNYDGRNSTFGDVSVKCTVPQPDNVSAFASQDSQTGSVKVMLINKQIGTAQDVNLQVANGPKERIISLYRLTSANRIDKYTNIRGSSGLLKLALPAQSITLVVIDGPRRPVASR